MTTKAEDQDWDDDDVLAYISQEMAKWAIHGIDFGQFTLEDTQAFDAYVDKRWQEHERVVAADRAQFQEAMGFLQPIWDEHPTWKQRDVVRHLRATGVKFPTGNIYLSESENVVLDLSDRGPDGGFGELVEHFRADYVAANRDRLPKLAA